MVDPALPAAVERVLLTREQLRQRVDELAADIARDYAHDVPVVIGVLRGMLYFMADLTRALAIPMEIDFMAISSYGPQRRSGAVRILKDLDTTVEGRRLLIVEDIVDTGLTLGYLLRNLQARGPADIQVCTLLNRPYRRLVDLPIAYAGFDIPDEFVVGYGLDFRQRYRNLPDLHVLRREEYSPPRQ